MMEGLVIIGGLGRPRVGGAGSGKTEGTKKERNWNESDDGREWE